MEENLQDSAVSVREISLPIYESKGWIKLIGVLSIIQGLAAALTVIGIVIAWLHIWVGVLLMQCASSIERARASGDKALLVRALGKLRTYFAIQGILTLVSLIVVVIAFSMGVLGAIFGLLSGWR